MSKRGTRPGQGTSKTSRHRRTRPDHVSEQDSPAAAPTRRPRGGAARPERKSTRSTPSPAFVPREVLHEGSHGEKLEAAAGADCRAWNARTAAERGARTGPGGLDLPRPRSWPSPRAARPSSAAASPSRGAAPGPGSIPLDEVSWELRTAAISSEKGEVIFEQQGVEIPAFWSQMATNVVASKYFHGALGTPERERSRQAAGRAAWPTPSRAGDASSRYFATAEPTPTPSRPS